MNNALRCGRIAALALAALAAPWSVAIAASGTLTIGAIVPQSWPNATEGEEIVLGMQLAIKTIPSVQAPTLVIKNDACDPAKGDAAARELVAAKVDLAVGSWCAIGQAPMIVAQAGLPYVSANAERLTKPPEGMLQLGRLQVYEAERIAANLRADTGLRISARTSCWMDFEPVPREQYDAILCPVLGRDAQRWQQAEATFTAAHRRPFTYSVARGYAAMEAALAHWRKLRAGAKASSEPLVTILGPVPAVDTPAPSDAMQLVLSPRLPRLSAREQATLDKLLQTKGCSCAVDGACAKAGPWGEQPFVVRGSPTKCAVLASNAPH